MKILFHNVQSSTAPITEDYDSINIKDSIEKTRKALLIAYSGFDNALETELIDSYIYEINSLQKRYEHLINLAPTLEKSADKKALYPHTSIKALVSHVLS